MANAATARGLVHQQGEDVSVLVRLDLLGDRIAIPGLYGERLAAPSRLAAIALRTSAG